MAGRKCWPGVLDHDLPATPGKRRLGDDFVLDSLLVERPLDRPAGMGNAIPDEATAVQFRATEACGSDWGQTHSMREAPTMASEPSPNRTSAFPLPS